jgi:hypothetical protein
MSDTVLCPNPSCGYRGAPKKKAKGSWLQVLAGLLTSGVLFLVFPLLGLAVLLVVAIYFAINLGHRYSCPSCGNAIPR